MDHPQERRSMGRAAVRMVARYDPVSVYDRWEELLVSLAESGHARRTAESAQGGSA